MSENIYVPISRILARYVWDNPKAAYYDALPHPGPGKTTYLSVVSDQPCWTWMLDVPPSFLGISTEVLICDSEQATRWRPDQPKESLPSQATGRSDTLVRVILPFADEFLFDGILKDIQTYLPPPHVTTAKVFGDPIPHRKPLHVRTINLNGQSVEVETLQPKAYHDGEMEKPLLYERGLPVRPIALPFHVNLLAVLPNPVPDALVEDLLDRFG